MKKIISLILISFLILGCSKKEEPTSNEKILSKGELVCAYKENRVKENTLYTSYYLFNFNDHGILENAVNEESIEFSQVDDKVKKKYKEALEESIKTYDDVKGVSVTSNLDEKKYSFTVKMNNNEMDEKTKEDYLLNMDRINTYKTFSSMGYTCE